MDILHIERMASYGSKHASQSLSEKPFVHTSTHNLKTTVRIWTSCISKDCSTMEESKVSDSLIWEHHHSQ